MTILRFCLTAILGASTSASAAVQGLYGSDCLAVDSLSATKDLLFHPVNAKGDLLFETVHTIYGDEACSRPVYDFSFSGPYALEGGRLDYSFHSIKLQALDMRIAAAFNEAQLCGFSDWGIEEPKEVAGLNCGGQAMPEVGMTLYDIVEETAEGIQLGLPSPGLDGLSPSSRPESLDPLLYLPK